MNARIETLGMATPASQGLISGMIRQLITLCSYVPHTLLAFLERFSITLVLWKSRETRRQALALDIVSADCTLAWPRLSNLVMHLFRDVCQRPQIQPVLMAYGPGKLSLDHWVARRCA